MEGKIHCEEVKILFSKQKVWQHSGGKGWKYGIISRKNVWEV